MDNSRVISQDLADIFQHLKSKNTDQQLQAALDLRSFVSIKMVDMSSYEADQLWDHNINRRLFELTHSQNEVEAFGGLLAIEHLLNVNGEETIESKRNLFRFYNYVKHMLLEHDVSFLFAASKVLGQIIKIGGAAFGERFMDYEVPAAIELMQPDKQEASRHAGVLMLKEFARSGPAYFFPHINLVLDNILVPLRDQSIIVREGAAELLAESLEIVMQGERQI